ncbi:spermidine synthase [Gulosibacter molinativorax]|uniref:Spermine synthase n=1 Tax=Gulosibacter molinativorax TaxID=256821 RepID=A0ABT7C894_9MICO|nr:fused MFS/spermidine synthase [Gulosibacter molinativorax]MDJ1371295.1 spermine synthase [Gulosibacter molinativorax]QUY63641.1 Spermidine synthase [Gulosibacter molinativorax]
MARKRQDTDFTATLASGRQAMAKKDGPRITLFVDGTPQSEINIEDPGDLSFGYIRHMSHVLDLAFPLGGPITAVHLGAGALTIPRYLEHSRPGSRQQVIELERDLVEFVREVAPLPAHASIRIRYGDAREQLAKLPRGLAGKVDALIVDVFAGSQTPAHVTSLEFFQELGAFLAPDGVVLVNISDGHDLTFARGEVATIREAIGPTQLISDPAVFKGRRFGNIVAAASRDRREYPGLARLAASGFPPATVHSDAQTFQWLRGATPVRDAQAKPSPAPASNIFRDRS